MSLRSRLLRVFASLAVVPLVALGVFEYARSMDAVRRLIVDQSAPIAQRAARQMWARLQIMDGDLRLLARNSETRRLYEAWGTGDSTAIGAARTAARIYFNEAWRVFGAGYVWIALRDSADHDIEWLGGAPAPGTDSDAAPFSPTAPVALLSTPVHDEDGRLAGSVVAAVRLDALVPAALLETRVGRGGYTVIADRNGSVFFDPLSLISPRGAPALSLRNEGQSADTAPVLQTIHYTERDTARVATVATIPDSPLVVIASGVVDEYAHSFSQVRITNLVLTLMLTGAMAVAFIVVTRRTTRPLETLTAAAAEVGRGNFVPALPPAGDDEVGRLTSAFATMSGHVDRMMKELESSRQMAAVGSFARQIAHEIRNPLTSIKLNLQSLERDARDGLVPPDSRRTVEICLEEIQRLDRVVRGVLTLGRTRSNGQRVTPLEGIVQRALDIVRPQLQEQGIRLAYTRPKSPHTVMANEEQLVGLFLNLLVNAAEAMPDGGDLSVSIDRGHVDAHEPSVTVTIADSGSGVPPAARNSVFEPFFTTKSEGSGLGLAVALRDAEAHHGTIVLADTPPERGATFVVELPLAAESLA